MKRPACSVFAFSRCICWHGLRVWPVSSWAFCLSTICQRLESNTYCATRHERFHAHLSSYFHFLSKLPQKLLIKERNLQLQFTSPFYFLTEVSYTFFLSAVLRIWSTYRRMPLLNQWLQLLAEAAWVLLWLVSLSQFEINRKHDECISGTNCMFLKKTHVLCCSSQSCANTFFPFK